MKCINCNLDKPDDECYPDGSYPLWSHYCRDCRNATMKIILDQHHDQMILMTHEEKKAFFTSDRKTHYPDWIVIDQPGFREKRRNRSNENDMKIEVNGELLFELANKNQWVSRVPQILPDKIRAGEQWLWVDKNGDVFEKGSDFMAAEEKATYPCRVYRLQNVAGS